MTDDANIGVTDLEGIARKVVSKIASKDIPQDEWITDPQDERLAGLPEWVPRPGETAHINWYNVGNWEDLTVKAVRMRADGLADLDCGGNRAPIVVEPHQIMSIGDRYEMPDDYWRD